MPRKTALDVQLVIPVYNEAGVIEDTYARLRDALTALKGRTGIIFVDDGSTDRTAESLQAIARRDRRVSVLSLSRNFGHQAALTAGMDAADADIIVTLDGDGQHPPELIPEMVRKIQEGFDVVQMQRIDEAERASFRKWASDLFYRLINAISGTQVLPGGADFRALSRSALEALKAMPEYHRFLRGMVAWIGFRRAILPYTAGTRSSGRTKYSLKKRLGLAFDAIFSFSLVPLYVGLSMGGVLMCLAALEMLYVLSLWATGRTSTLEPGWSSLLFVILIVGGMLMALLGFVGVYVGYIFQEVKRRPVYLVRRERPGDSE